MSDIQERLYAWLGKWGDDLPKTARAEFREALQDTTAIRPNAFPEPKEIDPALAKELDDARDEARPGLVPVAPKVKNAPVKRIYTIPQDAVCRRGEQLSDKAGQPFAHVVSPEGYCIFCNAGLPPPKDTPDPGANIFEHGGEEKVWCTEHGFHIVKVNPDGSFKDAPDCPMFKAQEQV